MTPDLVGIGWAALRLIGGFMGIRDAIGMMSTGALATLGIIYFVAPEALPQRGTTSNDATGTVSRNSTDLNAISPIGQIEAIVAMSEAGLKRETEMTPEQLEAIAFFENTAREMNQTSREKSADQVQFNNMAVADLQVLYYYTVPARYDALNRDAIMAAQEKLVTATLCNGAAIRTLMQDYGFEYTYTYVSADLRKIGEVTANAQTCS